MHCISIFNLKTVMYKIVSLLILSTIALSCKSAKISKTITKTVSSNFYDNQFTGIMIIDPETADTVYQYQAEKYFIPASNTKIATLFSALTLLKDSVPAFYYQKKADTLVIQGIGNPTFFTSVF
ncbi:D-alanyl-D-alanine carboxypeptidase [Formosa algae]|uniref:D-alanyl-D-alanine carboxypeptidase n=1 Tax=Formosa algae TaxID=225843 RepID=UPI0011AF7052|nr:D-alanyl-D-alanine carboxypeptidase [Formosa algae]